MEYARELVFHSNHGAAVKEKLGAVSEGVLHLIHVEVLIDVVAAVMTSAHGVAFDWPRILHPAELVDLMDVKVIEQATAQPDEAVKAVNLKEQFAHVLFLHCPIRESGSDGRVHAIRPHGDNLTDGTCAKLFIERLAPAAVPYNQADADL